METGTQLTMTAWVGSGSFLGNRSEQVPRKAALFACDNFFLLGYFIVFVVSKFNYIYDDLQTLSQNIVIP